MTSCRLLTLSNSLAAVKEERFRFGNGYDQVEDVIGVAQPVRFNSKNLTFLSLFFKFSLIIY